MTAWCRWNAGTDTVPNRFLDEPSESNRTEIENVIRIYGRKEYRQRDNQSRRDAVAL
jgi:hypothetical protein